ncbi:PH domain-containing protein [Streptomyces sp. GMY02]|uniref:PH domain-containing protein n=1 Tax=Streptomyces sp. GMY02 TaxID=1333528 RepID=UPI001C2CB55B|nr:PH domain-containing protein [Streptomyces sp. GMY02]QXE35059.1 PH domain-containing protein [Streptomyces sp. GMY02]
MTSPEHKSSRPEPRVPAAAPEPASAPASGAPAPAYRDRVYRSAGGILGGVLLLAVAAWLGIDALVRGTGRTPWLALAALLFSVPLITAFSLRPAVFAGEDRLRIRNPFRTIVLPWRAVTEIRATYSCEVFTEGAGKFQLWAVPVSLRARKRAERRGGGSAARGSAARGSVGVVDPAHLAVADRAMADLRALSAKAAGRAGAQGEPVVRWAYEVLAPTAAGLVLLVVLLLT